MTGACLLVKTAVYDEMHGLDEHFAVAFNDVDFCLRVRDAATALPGPPTPSSSTMRARAAAGMKKTPSRRPALRRNSSGSTPSTERKTFWMTPTTTPT